MWVCIRGFKSRCNGHMDDGHVLSVVSGYVSWKLETNWNVSCSFFCQELCRMSWWCIFRNVLIITSPEIPEKPINTHHVQNINPYQINNITSNQRTLFVHFVFNPELNPMACSFSIISGYQGGCEHLLLLGLPQPTDRRPDRGGGGGGVNPGTSSDGPLAPFAVPHSDHLALHGVLKGKRGDC